jgi:hypothetical protein
MVYAISSTPRARSTMLAAVGFRLMRAAGDAV